MERDDFLSEPELDYDTWREMLRQNWGWHSATDIERDGFSGRLRAQSVHGFTAMDFTCNACRVERTEQDVRRDHLEHYYVAIQVAGGSLVSQNDHVETLAPGDVAFVDSARPVMYAAVDGSSYGQWFCLQLPRGSVVSHLGFEPKQIARGRRTGRLLYQLALDAIGEGEQMPEQAHAYMRLAIYDLLGALFSSSDPIAKSYQTDRLFRRVCDIIQARFSDPGCTPGRIASEAGISLRYLQKLFTSRGSTCTQHIQSLRLDYAARLLERRRLLNTGQALSMIAFDCGFRDYTYFARAFRRRFGHAPGNTEFRAARDGAARPLAHGGPWTSR
jgi:AraC family transcriptional regulator, positive regulator of tynA and feaB